MPTFEITSPDGHIYHVDGPEGSTQEQALQIVQSQHAPSDGLLGRIGQDFDKRDQEMQNSADAYVQGKQSMPETMAQNALSMGQKYAVDPINEGLKSLNGLVQNTPVAIPQAIGQAAIHAAGQLPDFAGKPLSQGAEQVFGQVGQYLQDNPRLARNLNAAGEAARLAASVVPVANGLEAVGPAIKDAMASTPKSAIPSAASGFAEANKAYQVLDNSGATVTAKGVNDFLADAAKNTITDPKLVNAIGKSQATKYLTTGGDSGEGLMSLANESVTIQQIHAIDKDLSQQINKHFTDGLDSEGNQLMQLQDTFRQHFMEPNPENVTGGAEGFDAWQQANKLYSQASKMKAVEDVISAAKNTDNPASAIRTGMRNILKSAKKTRGYSDEELSALEKAADTGFATDALRTFGGRLMTGLGTALGGTVGAVGGPIGAIAGAGIGGGASFLGGRMLRGGAAAMQERGANNLLSIMGQNAKFNPITEQELMQMPAEQALKYLKARGAK